MTDAKKRQRRKVIEETVTDAAGQFMYYDRKEDDELPRGAIEEAVSDGVVTVDEIVAWFRKGLGAIGR